MYDPNNNHLNTEIWYDGTNTEIDYNYTYTPNGSLKRTLITASNQDRVTTNTYFSDSIRILTVTDPSAHSTSNRYDSYGRLTSTTDFLGNKDSLSYDNMNNVISEISAFGYHVTSLYSWGNPLIEPKNARYSVQKTGSDGAVTKSYLDKLGRQVRNDLKGFDGTMIYTVTNYNIKGQEDSISDPYYSSGSAIWNRYIYDNYGRATNLYRPSGRNTVWTYNSNSITETTAGKAFTKTYSSDGTVSAASDAGGTINYSYYPDGKVKTITAPGNITTRMYYDNAGNQIKLKDPSELDTIRYGYDGFGQLTSQTNARGQLTSINYYHDGRPQTTTQPEGTITYNYYPVSLLLKETTLSNSNIKLRYMYDSKGRVTSTIDSIPEPSGSAKKFTSSLTYDSKGRINTITHPSGIVETKNYNSYGYLSSVATGTGTPVTRWTTLGMNALQQITSGKYGSNLNTTIGYDNYGYLTSKVTGTIEDYSFNFDPVTGNLNWRQNNKYVNLKENFYYDNLDRLDNIYMGATMTLDMAYDASKGGITTKTDVGTMLYNTSGKPYAVSSINPATSLTPGNTQTLTPTSFEKISTISENNYNATFAYGSDDQRIKMTILQGSSLVSTRWYPTSSFMKDSIPGSSKLYTYIGGDTYTAPCVAIRSGSTTRYYYLIRDHLGSIIEISDSTNAKLYEYSYDAWGRMRNPSTWACYSPGSEPVLLTGRGFTGHEHLPWFNLINMNGRVYDALIGQFISPDNQIQNPFFTQNYNRYAYCFNNPLKLRDISGYDSWDYYQYRMYGGGGIWQPGFTNGPEEHYIHSAGYRSNYIYHWDELRQSIVDQYGNEVSYEQARNETAFQGSLGPKNKSPRDHIMIANILGPEFTITDFNVKGTDYLIASIGPAYLKFVMGGGYISKNPTASAFPLLYISEEMIEESELLEFMGSLGFFGHAVVGLSAELASKGTYKYGVRLANGSIKSGALMTEEGSLIFGNLATTFNVAGGSLSALVNGFQAWNDYKNGEYGWALFNGSKAVSYAVGVGLLLTPFDELGATILIRTMGVDVIGNFVREVIEH